MSSQKQCGKRLGGLITYDVTLFCLLMGWVPAEPETESLPIIDVDLHTLSANAFGNPPGIETPPGAECAPTNEALFQGTLAAFERNNVVLAVASGPFERLQKWHSEAPVRIVRGPEAVGQSYEEYVRRLEPLYEAGELEVFGEVGWQ